MTKTLGPAVDGRAVDAAITAMSTLLVSLAYWITSPTSGDFWWFDSARHAMNSVFVHDFFAQGGWRSPIGFARAYYDQYPGINIGFYPPLVYFVTAPVLGLFGVSHAACQAVIAAFSGLAAAAVYRLGRQGLSMLPSLALAVLVMLGPEMVLWGRQVQLDVPAVALLLWGCYVLIRWQQIDSPGRLLLAALLLGAAMLTRVQVVFVWPFWVVIVFLLPVARQRPTAPRVWATLLFALLSAPSLGATWYFSSAVAHLAGSMPNMPSLATWDNWTWYARQWPLMMGWPAIALLSVGALSMLWRLGTPMQTRSSLQNGASSNAVVITIAFGAMAWLFFSLVSNKELRFGLPMLPFLLVGAALLLAQWPRLVITLLPILAIVAVLDKAATDSLLNVPRVAGHSRAATLAAQLAPPHSTTLISAHRDGNFIFNLRANGGRQDLRVARADKLLVEIQIMRQLGVRDRRLKLDDVRRLLIRERVTVVVAQTGYLGDQPSMKALSDLLQSDCCFQLVERIAVEGQHRKDETELLVYLTR